MRQVSLEDDERLSHPADSLTLEKIAVVEVLVLSERHLKVKEMSAMTQISDTTVRCILHDHLGMNKASTKWVLKLLSAMPATCSPCLLFRAL